MKTPYKTYAHSSEYKRKIRKYNLILVAIFVGWILAVGGILGATLPLLLPIHENSELSGRLVILYVSSSILYVYKL